MPDNGDNPRFVQIGNRGIAVDHIVAVEIPEATTEPWVYVYLSSSVDRLADEAGPGGNYWTFVGNEAARFLQWWRHWAGVEKF